MRIGDTARPSHEPASYDCPFCANIAEKRARHILEVVDEDAHVFVKMNPRWRPRNPGSVLVIPVPHHENIYDLPLSLAEPLQRAVRDIALAMKQAFGCDGTSVRQHNEPAGNQKVWHYHIHVHPRWHGDNLYRSSGALAPEDEVRRRATMLRATLAELRR